MGTARVSWEQSNASCPPVSPWTQAGKVPCSTSLAWRGSTALPIYVSPGGNFRIKRQSDSWCSNRCSTHSREPAAIREGMGGLMAGDPGHGDRRFRQGQRPGREPIRDRYFGCLTDLLAAGPDECSFGKFAASWPVSSGDGRASRHPWASTSAWKGRGGNSTTRGLPGPGGRDPLRSTLIPARVWRTGVARGQDARDPGRSVGSPAPVQHPPRVFLVWLLCAPARPPWRQGAGTRADCQ